MPAELILVRHGESEANVGLTADPDSSLTELGKRQSQNVALQLAGCDLRGFLCLTSPYCRARQTAKIIAQATGLRFEIEPAVREWGPDAVVDGKSYPQEPIADVVVRLREFLMATRGRDLLIVSHASPIALLAQLARGRQPITTGAFWEGIENCCLRRVDVRATGGSPVS